jgi:hypothetical protein
MNKASHHRFQRFQLVIAFALLTSGIIYAQQPAVSNLDRPVPVEMAALGSAPESPALKPWASSHAEYYVSAAAPVVPFIAPHEGTESHRFWDGENRFLFAANAGAAAADFYFTHANLASGGRELNPVTRVLSGNTPALATNFALETGGVVAISYLFHRTGHHRLERLTSLVNLGGSVGAVSFDLMHR